MRGNEAKRKLSENRACYLSAVWRQGSISFETEAYGTNRQDTKSSIAGGVIKQRSHVGDSLVVPHHDAELVTV